MEPTHASAEMAFISDGVNLTPADVVRVARSGPPEFGMQNEQFGIKEAQENIPHSASPIPNSHRVGMSAEALERVAASRAIVDRVVERNELVYGITTGFGAFKDRVIPPDQVSRLQVNLLLSHCVGVGSPLPTEVVRALMLCRAHTLSLGYSGIRPATLQLIYDMLNAGVHPYIPEQGSVGASGDLAPLAHMALTLIGMGQAEWRGTLLPSSDALRSAGLTPLRLGAKEGVALSNGTSLMSALLSLALVDAQMLCDTADVVGALTLEALQGVPAAFDPRIHAARRHPGQIASAANIRALIAGSTLLDPSSEFQVPSSEFQVPSSKFQVPSSEVQNPKSKIQNPKSPKVQDAYSLRCMPQVHGPARDAAAYVHNVLLAELNSANDNPLIFPSEITNYQLPITNSSSPDDPISNSSLVIRNSRAADYSVLSGGNFHGAPLSVAADFLGIALAGLANISERRQARMVDAASNDGLLPPFLTPPQAAGLNSGFMLVQYTSAALASENKSLAHPASVDTIPTSANAEDHVSMGPIAARHARAIVANVARVLALEAFMAAQAIDFRLQADPSARLGSGSRHAYHLIRSHIPFLPHDADMQPHIAAATHLVTSGRLAAILREFQVPGS